jgi:hypothetical protein
VHGANQIRALGIAHSIVHASRISLSLSDRLARNAGREKMVLDYIERRFGQASIGRSAAE